MPVFTNRLIWRALVQYDDDDEVPELLRRSGGDPVMWMGQGIVRAAGSVGGGASAVCAVCAASPAEEAG